MQPLDPSRVQTGMYRDELDALTARHAALEADVVATTRERDDTARLVEETQALRRVPVLDHIRVASPCRADWSKMTGDDRSRHCGACGTQVFDLSSMFREEAEALIRERNGNLCARYYQRADGTILTADCVVGARKHGRKTAAVAAGLVAALAGGAAFANHHPAGPGEQPLADLPIQGELEPIRLGITVITPTVQDDLEKLIIELGDRPDTELMMGQMIAIVPPAK